jgi:DNA ligase D-like protein (predicted 3'-phosphoesterase)
MPLTQYRNQRNFAKTREPQGRKSRRKQQRFVVQKHDASALHYDFRLEFDGVLKSWAVPKGPSANPRDKRLANPTEDHPVEYIDFEGVIPDGEYGAGPVIVWDTGTYSNTTEKDGKLVQLDKALAAGHASFTLDGAKLHGGWSLNRIRRGKGETWLLIKRADDAADRRQHLVSALPTSVLTNRTIEQVAAEES